VVTLGTAPATMAAPDRRALACGDTITKDTHLGINAAPGTLDGGGNRAVRNGDPRQCVGVACGA
jgi:hypothetical protein